MDGCEKPQRVAVCVASYRRPQGLHALLGALDALCFEGPRPELALAVADNDPAGSARAVCEDARRWLSMPLHYTHEPRRGIAFARNASLRAAAGADWFAFIDDDEVPEARWLDELLRVQRESGADIVTGPVLGRFERPPAAWILEGGFFSSPRRATGSALTCAYAGNTLLRARCLDGESVAFDERLRRGEDEELSSRLAARGCRIVWADDAIAWESVPPARANARYVVRRALHAGAAATRIERFRRGALRTGAHALAHGAWCLLKGFALASAHARAGGRRARAFELAGYGAGRIAGLAGVG